MTDAPLTELETSAIEKGWLRDKPNSPRDVLLALFALCDDLNPVNYGGADEAADEVIRVLGRYGFVIVSNTPNLVPTPTAQEPAGETPIPAPLQNSDTVELSRAYPAPTGEAEGLMAEAQKTADWLAGGKIGSRPAVSDLLNKLITALSERDEMIAELESANKDIMASKDQFYAEMLSLRSKLAEARKALEEIERCDKRDTGIYKADPMPGPCAEIARAALAAIGGVGNEKGDGDE